jgi:hypothetical protein
MGQRRTSRDEVIVPVRIWGVDASGQPFIEAAFTRNISADGARLEGVPRKLQPGDIVGLTYLQKKTRLRVAWIGQAGSPEEGHVGLQALAGGESHWPLLSTIKKRDIYGRPPGKDRRQQERVKSNIKAKLHTPGQTFAIWGTVEDMCSGGCYLNTTYSLEAGRALTICLFLNNHQLWIEGLVISNHADAGIGIKFTRMDRQCREWLGDFTAAFASGDQRLAFNHTNLAGVPTR